MDAFPDAFHDTVGIEGGYVDNPHDRGGPTKYGITQAVARAHGYVGDMRNLPLGVAETIYRDGYWNLLRLDDVADVSKPVALLLFDIGVNSGIAIAAKYLQRALVVFNRQGRDYFDVPVDGVIGPLTVSCLRRLLAVRGAEGETVLLRALNALRGAGYIADAEAHPNEEDFVFGWFRTRIT